MTLCGCSGVRCTMSETDHRHGTNNGYNNLHCRCEACRSANAAKQRVDREARNHRPIPPHVHGTANGYGNWRCRCAACREAWRVDTAVQKRRRRLGLTDVAQGLVGQWTPRKER